MKVGDYVRTKKGIAKYLGVGRDILKYETSKNTYEHYYNQHLFDNYIFDVGHDYGDTLTNDEFNNIDELGKVKESIIDLIEVGDIIRGKDNHLFEVYAVGSDCVYIYNLKEFILIKDIKGIVTKEQFSQMEYKIGE